jgi:hypothetical protein
MEVTTTKQATSNVKIGVHHISANVEMVTSDRSTSTAVTISTPGARLTVPLDSWRAIVTVVNALIDEVSRA